MFDKYKYIFLITLGIFGIIFIIFHFNIFTTSKMNRIDEAESMSNSKSASWWLNSGGYFYPKAKGGRTIFSELKGGDFWQTFYAKTNPDDTDLGLHPQNIFRLITREKYTNFKEEAYFTIKKINESKSKERDRWSGLFLISRYKDGNNTYYGGIRMDGMAIIKSKKNGVYSDLSKERIFEGNFDRLKNLNLIPQGREIGVRLETRNRGMGTNLQLFVDFPKGSGWKKVLEVDDNKDPIIGNYSAGIRSDFMDMEFDDWQIVRI